MENNNKKKLQDFIVKIIRGFLWWINRIEGREPWPGYKRVYPKGYKKPEGFLQIVENKFKIFVGIRPQPYFEKINPNDNQPSCLKEYIKDSIIIYLGYKKRGDFIPAKKKTKKTLIFSRPYNK